VYHGWPKSVTLHQTQQHLRLVDGPGITIQDHTGLAIGCGQTLFDQSIDHFVRHQTARFRQALGFFSNFIAGADMLAQHVAGGNMRTGQALSQEFRLCAFAGPGRSKKDDGRVRVVPICYSIWQD
jgi:hypothetical protein